MTSINAAKAKVVSEGQRASDGFNRGGSGLMAHPLIAPPCECSVTGLQFTEMPPDEAGTGLTSRFVEFHTPIHKKEVFNTSASGSLLASKE